MEKYNITLIKLNKVSKKPNKNYKHKKHIITSVIKDKSYELWNCVVNCV